MVYFDLLAGVSELADEADSKSVAGNRVRVQAPPPVPFNLYTRLAQLGAHQTYILRVVGSSPSPSTNKGIGVGENRRTFYITRLRGTQEPSQVYALLLAPLAQLE